MDSRYASVPRIYYKDEPHLLSKIRFLSIVSENVCSHVVPKLKMDVLAVVYERFFDGITPSKKRVQSERNLSSHFQSIYKAWSSNMAVVSGFMNLHSYLISVFRCQVLRQDGECHANSF